MIILFLVGAITGSFLNVVIYRLPRKESLAAPGSHCPRCKEPVKWYDNIPIVSYMVLQGQCRNCGQPITPRYPTVETLTGALWVVAGIQFGMDWPLLPALLLISVLIAIFYIDLDHYIIPNVIVLPAAVIGLAANVAISPGDWWVYVVAGLGAGIFFLAVALLYPGGSGMGFGDVKLACMLGFFLGGAILPGLFLSFAIGAFSGIFLLLTGQKGRKSRIPFGPFMAIGSIIALFYGDRLLELWLGLAQ